MKRVGKTVEHKDKISVIVPVYHVEAYLKRCLDSILSQSYRNIEVILVNDGGTEEETALCLEYAAKDDRIIYVCQENQGLSAARNKGLSLATGDYLQFVDSDDWIFPEALEVLLRTASDIGADMVIFDVQYEWEGHSYLEKLSIKPGVYSPESILEQLAIPSIPPYAWNKFCLRSLYDGVLFPVGEKWEDVPTVIYPVSRAKRIAVLDKPLYHYYQRDDAITKQGMQDGSIHKWRFLQYAKRYDFLKTNYPEIAPAARTSLVRAGMSYYAYCLHERDQRQERQRVLSFIQSSEMGEGLSNTKVRLIRFGFCLLPDLTARIFRLKHKRKG